MRFLRRSLIGTFLLGLTAALLAGAAIMVQGAITASQEDEGRRHGARERVISVNTLQLTPETIAPKLTTFGQLQSARVLDIRSAATGTVTEIAPAFVEGGMVQQGDLLLRLNTADADAALARAEADQADAEAELRDAESGLSLAQDDLSAAEAQARLRQTGLDRQLDLQRRGVGTVATVEAAELAAASADQAVVSRRQAVIQAQSRIDLARTRLSRTQIALSEAERGVADTELYAGFSGALTEVTVIAGGRVTANEKVAQLFDPEALEVSFNTSTAQYARLLNADGELQSTEVSARLDVQGLDLIAKGQITRQASAVGDGQTGRMLFATLDSAPGFRPGDFVTVTITEPPLEGVMRLPATAVAADQTVLVVGDEDRLELRDVRLLRQQGDDVLIRSRGLGGQQVVAERSPLLGVGIKVKPTLLGAEVPETPQTVTLDPARRAKLVSFVENSRMPDDRKTRVLQQLQQDEVPAAMVERLESRIGG